jgi:hypothetical protein
VQEEEHTCNILKKHKEHHGIARDERREVEDRSIEEENTEEFYLLHHGSNKVAKNNNCHCYSNNCHHTPTGILLFHVPPTRQIVVSILGKTPSYLFMAPSAHLHPCHLVVMPHHEHGPF